MLVYENKNIIDRHYQYIYCFLHVILREVCSIYTVHIIQKQLTLS